LHDVPNSIVSYNDSKFLAIFWTMLWHRFDTSLKYNSIVHPQTNDQMEIVNHALENLIWSFCGDKLKQWNQDLPKAKFAYNSVVHGFTSVFSFVVVYRKVHVMLLTLFNYLF